MALNQQIWLNAIVENLYPDNSFASKSIDDSQYVNYHKVHIPNAGRPSEVRINGVGKAPSVHQREDHDLEYGIDKLQTLPVLIENAETIELSYDKRMSILRNDREELARVAHMNILSRWANGAGAILKTTGEAVAPHTYDGATGKRKALKRSDVLGLMTKFNKWELPSEERYLLLDADMYAQLLGDLAESDKYAFFASADAQKGILGKLYGFNIMTRSSVLRIKADAETLLAPTEQNEASECAVALAWHKSCVSRALGEVKMFANEDDPEYYGSTYSFEVRTGGSHRRYDKRGVALLVEATHN